MPHAGHFRHVFVYVVEVRIAACYDVVQCNWLACWHVVARMLLLSCFCSSMVAGDSGQDRLGTRSFQGHGG